MIKKILKDVLGENFTENNEKYAKINDSKRFCVSNI